MRNEEFEQILKQALAEKAQEVEASPFLLEKIKDEAEKRERKKETISMKFFSVKKLAVVAAVCLMSVTCYAALNISGSVGHTSNNIMSFSKMEKAEKKLGMDAKFTESFSNGFTFERGGTGGVQGVDEEGNPTGKEYASLTIGYKNNADERVTLIIEDGNPYAAAGEDVADGYAVQLYKFVPPDYELTAEDEAKAAAGDLMISYGSSEVEEKVMENYSWQEDGMFYSLVASDCDMGEAVMAQMAEEIKAE